MECINLQELLSCRPLLSHVCLGLLFLMFTLSAFISNLLSCSSRVWNYWMSDRGRFIWIFTPNNGLSFFPFLRNLFSPNFHTVKNHEKQIQHFRNEISWNKRGAALTWPGNYSSVSCLENFEPLKKGDEFKSRWPQVNGQVFENVVNVITQEWSHFFV